MRASSRDDLAGRRRGRPCETLVQIPDEIFGILDADRETDGSRSNARRAQLVVVQLPVRRAGRVDDQALRIADVGPMRPETHSPDEVLSGGAPAAAYEREPRPG